MLSTKRYSVNMIARYSILLPFELTLDAELALPPLVLSIDGERVLVHQPTRALLDADDLHAASDAPVGELALKLVPGPKTPTYSVTVDGKPTIHANLLIVDFSRESFERRRDSPLTLPADPPAERAIEAANELLRRIRVLARASNARLLNPDDVLWLLRYLKEDETPVDDDPRLYRERWVNLADWRLVGITPRLWTAVSALASGDVRRVWEDLLLDADALFAEAGPALVLAQSALETFARATLERLFQASGMPSRLWAFLFRDGREPPLDAQLDELLVLLCGHSLKERNDLWEAYKTLKKARNSYAHGGEARIEGRPVTRTDLANLLVVVRDIIDWVETFLPAKWRRPSYEETATFALDKAMFSSDDPRLQARINFDSRTLGRPGKPEMP